MATYTTVADASGNFSINFPVAVNGGQKTTVTASKDGVTRAIEIYAPSGVVGGGDFTFSGSLHNFPSNIGDVTLGDGFTGEIGNSVFYYNSSYPSIAGTATGLHILGQITSIGTNAFRAWPNAERLTLPDSLQTIGANAFNAWAKLKNLKFKGGLIAIGDSAFVNNNALESIDFTEATSLTTIGASAFSGSSALTSITKFPAALTSLGASAFKNTKPDVIDLSDCVELTSIGAEAFSRASTATALVLPPYLQSIGASAFLGCGAATVDLPASLTSIGNSAFDSSKLTAIQIPALVNSLGNSVFSGASMLKSITFLGSLVTTLPAYFLRNCSGFDTELVIPSHFTSIGSYALAGLTSCPKITILGQVTTIGTFALSSNSSLTHLRLHANTPPSISSNTLKSLPASCIIEVPAASLAAYKAATYWSSHASKMVGI